MFVGALSRIGQDWNTLLETTATKKHSFWMDMCDKFFCCFFFFIYKLKLVRVNKIWGWLKFPYTRPSSAWAMYAAAYVPSSGWLGSQKLALMAPKVSSCPALPWNADQILCIFIFLKTFCSQLTVNHCIWFRELKTRAENLTAALRTFANFLYSSPVREGCKRCLSLPMPDMKMMISALGEFPRISTVLWSRWKACGGK